MAEQRELGVMERALDPSPPKRFAPSCPGVVCPFLQQTLTADSGLGLWCCWGQSSARNCTCSQGSWPVMSE